MENKECFRVQKVERKNKLWLVKDGSVDTRQLDLLGINYIVYRDTKPTIIEF